MVLDFGNDAFGIGFIQHPLANIFGNINRIDQGTGGHFDDGTVLLAQFDHHQVPFEGLAFQIIRGRAHQRLIERRFYFDARP